MSMHFPPALRLVRIGNILFIAIFQILLRYCVILPILEHQGIEPALSLSRFILLVIATTTLAASGNVINDYFDVSADRINRPEKVIVGQTINRRTVLLTHVILTLIGMFTGLFLAFVFRKESYALLFIVVPVILWFYSTTLKKQMLIGNLTVALLIALSAYLVVSMEFTALVRRLGASVVDSQACSMAWFYTSGFAFFALITNLAREIIKDMEDIQGDRACGCHTLPIDMGIGYSKTIVVILEIMTIVAIWAAYLFSTRLSNVPYIEAYLTLLLTVPTIVICFLVVRAQESRQFHRASLLSKIVMLAGMLLALYIYLLKFY